MAGRLRIGVIGLGRRWARYRQVLAALGRDVRVTALHDSAAARGEAEARDLEADFVPGITDLIERDDVDALLVPGGNWLGLWPVSQAVVVGKPVLCSVSPAEDPAQLAALREAAHVHVALWPALLVALEALAEQAQESIGQPLFLQGTLVRHGDGDLLATSAALALLRACADRFESDPRRISVQTGPATADVLSLLLNFADDRVAQLTFWGSPAARSRCRLHVEAESGSATVELPRRIEWNDLAGRHTLQLPGGLAEGLLVDRFVQALRDGEPAQTGMAWACEAIDWLRAARQSRETGQPVDLG
ncbi:MAG: Gfo/Idh/MocA family oxidoreductase [Gemmataceae bacterium]